MAEWRRRLLAWAVHRWPDWAHRRRLKIRLRHLQLLCGRQQCRCLERIERLTPKDAPRRRRG